MRVSSLPCANALSAEASSTTRRHSAVSACHQISVSMHEDFMRILKKVGIYIIYIYIYLQSGVPDGGVGLGELPRDTVHQILGQAIL